MCISWQKWLNKDDFSQNHVSLSWSPILTFTFRATWKTCFKTEGSFFDLTISLFADGKESNICMPPNEDSNTYLIEWG